MNKNEVFITEGDRYLFGNGTHYEIYEKLGAHPACLNGKDGYYFAVWAPNAARVSLVGDFNNWNEEGYEMKRIENSGIHELFIETAKAGDNYKYLIDTAAGERLYKADPYACYAEVRPNNASVVYDLSGFKWTDAKWMKGEQSSGRKSNCKKSNNEKAVETAKENTTAPWEKPMAIYECHLGSWKKKDDGTEDGFLNYRELAKQLSDYVLEMGYTHVELMGIAEYPFDGSWGYQVTGYYAPTSRYGNPHDFMYFINYLHKKGIGVILDWVPAHFPKDAHGLALFDGTPTYEYADPRKGEHPDWGTKVFDYEKNEVSNFLIANALYWVEKFHVDGLRVDAVASMLYLDYGRQSGQWIPNRYGGNGNLEAMQFFRHLNSIMKERNPRAITIAEESTAWPKITGDPKEDGLGFTFKWNMGWMHDFLEYMKLDPYFRKDNHNKMTFAMTYAHSENYILVLSHDEVVHLKCSMLEKMPGYYEDKFANLKVGYTYMMGHPGKKLLFMGQDFGQPTEWNEKKSLDWHLLGEEPHAQLQDYVKKLFNIYKKYPACYEGDQHYEGFEWINADDSYRSIFSFIRKGKTPKDSLVFVTNFTPVAHEDYRVGVPVPGKYKLLLNNLGEGGKVLTAEEGECDGKPYSVSIPLTAYGTAILKFDYVEKGAKK